MGKLKGLTEIDTAYIKQLRKDVDKLYLKLPKGETRDDSINQASDIYVALTPSGGIAALDDKDTSEENDDEPGTALCEIWRIDADDEMDPIEYTTGNPLEKTVYNTSRTKVGGDTWIIVGKLKGGKWVVLNPGRGFIRFELKDNMPTSGSVTAGQSATAHPLNANGTIDLTVAKEFEVYDFRGIHRGRGYVSSLIRGSQGYAELMPDSGLWEIQSLTPHAHRISGDAGSIVYFDDTQFTLSGTPVILFPPGALVQVDPTGANLIKNPLGLQFANGELLQAVWNEHHAVAPQWEAVDGNVHRPHRISGVTSGAVLTTDSTFTLSGTPVIMNPIGAISEEDYTAADLIYNVFGFAIDSGALIHAEFNEASGHWECVQAVCPA